jgi:hypothetical protein
MGLHQTKKHSKGNSPYTGEAYRIGGFYSSDKGLKSRLYRDLRKLNFKRINDTMNKWANEMNRNFTKE